MVLFNINGSGLGHLSTCLAYANRLRGRARPVFFSLASAIEVIHDMGYEADYMVSRFWSRASSWAWDQQLALRLGLLFERVRPDAVVFDGTWPYRGLLHAARVHGVPKLIWSNLVLYKARTRKIPVRDDNFDLLIRLGEIGADFSMDASSGRPRRITIPPMTMLKDEELLDRHSARDVLGLRREARYALFSLGPGNLKKVDNIAHNLIAEVVGQGFEVIWAQAPISQDTVTLPDNVISMKMFPIVRYLRAFDVMVSAAGYNTCCEVLQSGIPTLFVPNELVSDDQLSRAQRVADYTPAVVASCENEKQTARAVEKLVSIFDRAQMRGAALVLDGAERAAEEILTLIYSTTFESDGPPFIGRPAQP